jgi:hypothetical protein
MAHVVEGGNYKNLTSSGAVSATAGTLLGFYVNSTTSGTVALLDGGSGGTAITGTITPAIGWHRLPSSYGAGGLYATLGATINVTFIYAPSGSA